MSQGVIDGGSLVQQSTVITVLRITPLVPFRSAPLPPWLQRMASELRRL